MLTLVTPPAALLSAAQAKARAPALADAPDTLVNTLIASATAVLDGRDGLLGRAIGAQTWDWKPEGDFRLSIRWCGDRLNSSGLWHYLELPLPPLQGVTSITYKDSNGDPQTWASSDYHVSGVGGVGRVTLKSGASWPTLGDYPEPLTVRFVAGYTTVPEPILQEIAKAAITDYASADREPGIASVTTEAGTVAYSFASNRTSRGVLLESVTSGALAQYRVF